MHGVTTRPSPGTPKRVAKEPEAGAEVRGEILVIMFLPGQMIVAWRHDKRL